MKKLLNPQSLLWLALVLALTGSLKHLAAIFASVDNDTLMGWLQAVAIDAGLFALAYSIKVRKVSRRSVKPLWFGVILFSGISIYGNLAYGLVSFNGSLPLWIASSRPYVLAGSLPILVLFLAELLSDDRQYEQRAAAKVRRSEARAVSGITLERSKPAVGRIEPAAPVRKCAQCGEASGKSGEPFRTQAALNAHQRFCAGTARQANGQGKEVTEHPPRPSPL